MNAVEMLKFGGAMFGIGVIVGDLTGPWGTAAGAAALFLGFVLPMLRDRGSKS